MMFRVLNFLAILSGALMSEFALWVVSCSLGGKCRASA